MSSHHEAIARRMIARIAPGPDGEEPSSPTDITTDESAVSVLGSAGAADLVLTFAGVLATVARLAWRIYEGLGADADAARRKAARAGDMPALQRETARLKGVLLARLQSEAVTPPELPARGRARILEAAAEETLVEAERAGAGG